MLVKHAFWSGWLNPFSFFSWIRIHWHFHEWERKIALFIRISSLCTTKIWYCYLTIFSGYQLYQICSFEYTLPVTLFDNSFNNWVKCRSLKITEVFNGWFIISWNVPRNNFLRRERNGVKLTLTLKESVDCQICLLWPPEKRLTLHHGKISHEIYCKGCCSFTMGKYH